MKKIAAIFIALMIHCALAFGADTKVTALTENTAPAGGDILYMVDDPGGSPLSQKVSVTNLFAHAQPVVFANGETVSNVTDDTVAVLSNDENTTFAITGYEAKTGVLKIQADQGDDAADTFSFTMDAANLMTIATGATTAATVSTAGLWTMPAGITSSLATDASSLTAGSIITAGGIACAKQLFVGDDIDMSVSGTGVYDITLKDNVADALSIVRGTTDMMVFDTETASPAVTIVPDTTITGDLTITGSDVTIGAAGVKLTGDGDGALTLLGLGNGSDEDLTINLDDTANTAVISSSTGVTLLSIGAIGITSTGTVTQASSVLTPTAIASLGAATLGKMVITSDSGNATDCTTASGTGSNLCIGDGSAFVFVKSVKATA